MPKALVSKPIIKKAYRIKCYRCGHEFITAAKTLLIGYATCGACNGINYITEEPKT